MKLWGKKETKHETLDGVSCFGMRILEGVKVRDKVCSWWPFIVYSQEKNALHTWKITCLLAFLPIRNILQFCSIPWTKRSNYPGNSDQASVHSPGFLVHHSSRVVALVLLPGCPEDESWVNEDEQIQHGEYYHQYTANESHNVAGIWV